MTPPQHDETVMGDLDDGPPASDYDAQAIVASRSTAYLGLSLSLIALSTAGLFLAPTLVHRLLFATSLLSTIYALRWGVRLLDAVLREQREAASRWPQYIHAAWFVQRLSLLCAISTTVLLGLGR